MIAALLLLGSGFTAQALPLDTDAFRIDPWAPPREGVVSGQELEAACLGLPALREAGMSCPLDLQKALRGLPTLAAACSATEDGQRIPVAGFDVPHPYSVRAAVTARVRAAARQRPSCAWSLTAVRQGDDLLVSAPTAAGVEELRLGWRTGPDGGNVQWMRPLDANAAPEAGTTARRALLDPLLIRRGEFDLVIDILDSDGATTRLTVPATLPEGERASMPLMLGPPLEVAVGAEGNVLPITSLGRELPPEPFRPNPPPAALDGSALRRGPQVTERPLSPQEGATLARWCRSSSAGLQAAALTPGACTLLSADRGPARAPHPTLSPSLRRAAREDLRQLPRNLGEELLRVELALPATEQVWYRLDGAVALAAAGGFFEALLDGAAPHLALASWARSRGPVYPDGSPTGRKLSFAQQEGASLTPVSASLYLASLLAAVASPAEATQGAAGARELRSAPPPEGALLLAAAITLSRPNNLPGAVPVPWSQSARPAVGEADRPTLVAIAQRLAFLHADQAERLLQAHSSGGAAGVIEAGAALMLDLDAAVSILPIGTGEDEATRRARRLRLGALLDPLLRAAAGWGSGELLQVSASLALLQHDPTLLEQIPQVQTELDDALRALSGALLDRGAASPPRGQISAAVGLQGSLRSGEAQLGPSIPLGPTWSWSLRTGGSVGAMAQLLDLGAPLAWRPDLPAGAIPWERLFAPGLSVMVQPTAQPLALWPSLSFSPGPAEGSALQVGLSVGVTRLGQALAR